MKKPIDSTTHAIMDYSMSGIPLLLPALLGLNRKARRTYQAMGLAMLGLNTLTDTPVGLTKLISVKDHQKADAGMLAGLAAMTASKMVSKDRKGLAFHLGFITLVAAQYLLTDYDSD